MTTPLTDRLAAAPLDALVAIPRGAPAAVLCFLHGYDEGAPAPIEPALTRHGPLAPSAAPAARERFLVVAPQLPRAGDLWHHVAGEVVGVVEAAVRHAGLEGAGALPWCLTGFSFGGNGVFDLAAAQPGRWRALWAVDPTRVPATALGDAPVWLSVGDAARWRGPDFVRRLGLVPVPAGDGVPDESRLWLDAGLDHVGSARHAYADPRPYGWMLARAGAEARG